MPVITRALLRKRAEHNEGIISTLEEISLHQEELEEINPVLGLTCRKLKILYLQNNIIPRIENLVHLKELEYVNLALNNITKIEGFQNCEFVKKLDLTVNFIDVDELESSMDHLSERKQLRILYMMGNPCEANWPSFINYVVARLPQLESLDGKEITRSMQILANQKFPQIQAELRLLAEAKRKEKADKKAAAESSATKSSSSTVAVPATGDVSVTVEDAADNDCDEEIVRGEDPEAPGNEMTDNTPEARVEIYRELAQQKREKEERDNMNKPKERNYEQEQQDSVSSLRGKEKELPESEIKQKNEGGWTFLWDEESKPGFVILEVMVSRFLDSSLIDVDVHPAYVSMIIKSKLLRLRIPAEVKASESKCQRSKTTGSLVIIMPKVNAKVNTITPRCGQRSGLGVATKVESKKIVLARDSGRTRMVRDGVKKLSVQEQMLADAMQARTSQRNDQGQDPTDSADRTRSCGGLLDIGASTTGVPSSMQIVRNRPLIKENDVAIGGELFELPSAPTKGIEVLTPSPPH